ncbi:MAG: hypothetical protein SGPRY_013040, partial [Prymnesium sp.]
MLCELLHTPTSTAEGVGLLTSACAALAQLGCHNSAGQAQFVKRGGMVRLCDILRQLLHTQGGVRENGLCEHALQLLAVMSTGQPGAQDSFLEEGGVRVLSEHLKLLCAAWDRGKAREGRREADGGEGREAVLDSGRLLTTAFASATRAVAGCEPGVVELQQQGLLELTARLVKELQFSLRRASSRYPPALLSAATMMLRQLLSTSEGVTVSVMSSLVVEPLLALVGGFAKRLELGCEATFVEDALAILARILAQKEVALGRHIRAAGGVRAVLSVVSHSAAALSHSERTQSDDKMR